MTQVFQNMYFKGSGYISGLPLPEVTIGDEIIFVNCTFHPECHDEFHRMKKLITVHIIGCDMMDA